MIARETRTFLLNAARNAIMRTFEPAVPECAAIDDPILQEPRGLFVTLHTPIGALRGCIGYIEPVDTLYKSVIAMAKASAFQDPRFAPVTKEEFASLEIEITVLSPLRRIARVNEIEVGRHGLVATKGRARGLLLPQVPVEQGWDRDAFVSHTCMKAGLPPDAWKDGSVTFEVFEGEAFNERGESLDA